MSEKKISPVYKFIKWLVWVFYPKTTVEGAKNLPHESCIIVGNHAQLHGPIMCELYFPRRRYTWCAGEMAEKRSVAEYAFCDFWSHKPKHTHWFYKTLSHLISPLSACVFNNADVIHVHRDMRIISTFRNSVDRLEEGADVVIFPEKDGAYNNIVSEFQDKFVDTARYYYKNTGKGISFVPVYIAPSLKKIVIGKPVPFDPNAPIKEERPRICRAIQNAITDLALAQPHHTVFPYRNISKKFYPKNIPKEVSENETARC